MAFEKFKKRRAAELERRKIRSDRVKLLLLERGLSVFSKFGVCKVMVFGSVADGVCSEMSDIDILVMPLKNNQYWDFRYELEEAVGLPIDLYTDLDDPIMVEKIISRGETLYEVWVWAFKSRVARKFPVTVKKFKVQITNFLKKLEQVDQNEESD